MAESAVKILLDKLASLFENDVQFITGIKEEVVFLRGELERIRAFLRVADSLQDTDEELKTWVQQVRDLAHDTENALDEYSLLQAHHHDHTHGLYGSIHRLSCCIKNTKARYRVAYDLQAINSRVRKICQTHVRIRQKIDDAKKRDLGSSRFGKNWEDGEILLLEKEDLVGLEEPIGKLVGWVINGGSGRKVVSVSGMGGLGKTTLAKQVYDAAEVKKRFKVCAWITVSQSFKMGELLKDLVGQLFRVVRSPLPEGLSSMNNCQLKELIKELLKKRRYLIVLDDVWHLYEWDSVKYIFPNNNYGSRVIVTTRNADLASVSSLESDGNVYNLKPLPVLESWNLLCRKAFQVNSCPPHLEEVCGQILRKCEGLPLAIVAIGGVLAMKDTRRIDEWEMVAYSLGTEMEGNDKLKGLKKVLSLSFNDLPYYLKSCFLYLSIFPEDYLIEHSRIIRLWIAEGFVEPKGGKTPEDVAEEYFNELLNRSLLLVAVTIRDGRIKKFRIHDLFREIIISKSRDQNFAATLKERDLSWPDKVRRLSIHNTLENVRQDRSVSHLRSLFMFGVNEKPSIHTLFPKGFRLLCVLDFGNSPLNKFPVEVVNLFFLKYLSLRNTKVKIVPKFIGKLLNLETLDLKHCLVTELPLEILKLQRLRHLLVYRYQFTPYGHFHSKYGFKFQGKIGSLRSLQKLCFIEADQENIIELGKLNQLGRLGIIKLRKQDGKALCSSIENLTKLCALSITSIDEDEILDLQHLFSPPILLQRLYLRGKLEILPHWIPSLHSLVILYLKWSRLKDDPIVFLQSLPNLVHLELCKVYEGGTLHFTTGGFKKLKHLGVDKFNKLRTVDIEVGAMPCMETLSIQRCKLLEEVPSGIEHLPKLRVLEFFDMPEKLMKTLCPDAQETDYWKVSHIPEVYCTFRREGGWEAYSLERFCDKESNPGISSVTLSHELPTRWKCCALHIS